MLRISADSLSLFAFAMVSFHPKLWAQNPNFHNAPVPAKDMENPNEGQHLASEKSLYHLRCAACHGENEEGSGNIGGRAQSVTGDGSKPIWRITYTGKYFLASGIGCETTLLNRANARSPEPDLLSSAPDFSESEESSLSGT